MATPRPETGCPADEGSRTGKVREVPRERSFASRRWRRGGESSWCSWWCSCRFSSRLSVPRSGWSSRDRPTAGRGEAYVLSAAAPSAGRPDPGRGISSAMPAVWGRAAPRRRRRALLLNTHRGAKVGHVSENWRGDADFRGGFGRIPVRSPTFTAPVRRQSAGPLR
jgi:hypothetical protein